MRNVYVLGTGMLKFGRYPEKTVPELGGDAVELALKDAGIKIQWMVEYVAACGNALPVQCAMVGQRILQLGVTESARPAFPSSTSPMLLRDRIDGGDFREAYMSIAAGMYDCAMAVGVEQMGKQGPSSAAEAAALDPAYSTEGKIVLRPDARGVRPGRHRAHAQLRDQDGALRQDFGEVP